MANETYLDPRISLRVKASPISLNKQRELFEGVQKLKSKYAKLPGLDRHFAFDEQEGITGSNLPYLVLANIYLSEKGKRTPALWEGMQLDQKGLLTNRVWRDYGIAVFNRSSPNSNLAKKLTKLAKTKGLELPLLIHPLSLHPTKNGSYSFDRDDSLIVSGEEAKGYLRKFSLVGNSSIQRLGRDFHAIWGAYSSDLFYSSSFGGVDWNCDLKLLWK